MTAWVGMAATPKAPRPELRARVLARALSERRRSRWRLAAAVVLLALGAGGTWAWQTVGTLQAVQAERAALAARATALLDTLSLLRAAGTRVHQIPVSTNGRAGAVTIFDNSATQRWLVSCAGLAPNEPDQAYQIWFVTAAGPLSAALMPMDDEAPMVMALDLPSGQGAARVLGVSMSIEPRAGSQAPTGPVVFDVRM